MSSSQYYQVTVRSGVIGYNVADAGNSQHKHISSIRPAYASSSSPPYVVHSSGNKYLYCHLCLRQNATAGPYMSDLYGACPICGHGFCGSCPTQAVPNVR